ncbi:MAG TPA: NAD(P)H-binding protein [Burkholderiales bacterium]|nr:NAD(P)H-binding protein [Burkholderiales bacterium]
MAEPRSALLVGATGLIGSFLLRRLLEEPAYRTVTVWARRPLALHGQGLRTATFDFEYLGTHKVEAEDVFCCLGTTMKHARTREVFRRVDRDYPLVLAQAAARGGAKRLLVVSALGADLRSRVFYNRVKGEMEFAVRAAGVPSTIFFRPTLLAGPRDEFRLGERIGLAVGDLLGPLLGKYRPIEADVVAAAMIKAALTNRPSGVVESDQIRTL